MDLTDALQLYRAYWIGSGAVWEHLPEVVIERDSFFYFSNPGRVFGRNGAIVPKSDGQISVIGSGLNAESAVWAYERGIVQGPCDLTVTAFAGDMDSVIDVLTKTPPSQRGMKTPGPGRERWYRRLSVLPSLIFENADIVSYVDELKTAEEKGIFQFEIRASVA